MRSSVGTPGGAKLGRESVLKPVHCSIAPESVTGTSRPIVPNPTENARLKHTDFRRFELTRCAAALSVEGSRLARRPPRKRRAAAFTPRSETTIGTGLNSSEREDIQTMYRQVFRAVVLGAMERKTGLSKWPILSRIVAAQFRRFGLTTLHAVRNGTYLAN
jgi:hypothetical protein